MDRPRRHGAALLATGLIALCCAASPALGAAPPAAVPLTAGWQYVPDPGDHGLAAGFQGGTTGSGWQDVQIPRVFDPVPRKSEFHGSVGWYRTTFTGPSAPGFNWAVRFLEVRRSARVWLNGREIGSSDDPYAEFTLPATGLRPGQPNTLVVRADSRKGAEPREGWWNWGGIIRPVSLVPRGSVELDDPALMSRLTCAQGGSSCHGGLLFDGTVANDSEILQAPTVHVQLTPPAGAGGAPIQVEASTRVLAPGETARLRFTIAVPHPVLWAPDTPRLYAATVTTTTPAGPQQVDRLTPGLRQISVHAGELEVNGRAVELRGAAIQEDVKGRGPALTDADMDRIVANLKAIHANVTRAHYGLNPGLLDRFDRAGILVWSQAPVYHRDALLTTEQGRDDALAELRATVLAARGHPSTLTHSVANELSPTPEQAPGTEAYLLAADGLVKDLDPTLPVAVDLLSYPGYPASPTYARYDLLGINSYFGWYRGKPDHPTARLGDLDPFLRRIRIQYPRQGLVLTEFGAESTMQGPATEKQTYAFQSRYIDQVLGIVAKNPFVSGAIYWTLQEFAVKPDWNGGAGAQFIARDGIHHKGLIAYDGVAKPAFAVTRAAFARVPLWRPGGLEAAAPGGSGPSTGWLTALGGALLLLLVLLDGWALRGILQA